MGYETLCFALYEQRDLVAAIAAKLADIVRGTMARLVQFKRIRAVWGMDDMGFRTGTMISPADLREFILPVHKHGAQMAHDERLAVPAALLRQPQADHARPDRRREDRRQAQLRGHHRDR